MEDVYYPSISVVTPSFNQGAFLEATLQSVLSQGYPALEYIVVDGGSTDGSVDVIQRYADQLDWWVSEADHGQSEAINKGFRQATGELIGWVNSDDLLMPGTLLKVAEAFEKNPDAVLVYGDVDSIDADGQIFNTVRYGEWGLLDLMRFSILGQPAVFMRRKLLRALGYLDESFHFLMDHQLWLKMAQEGVLMYLPTVLAKARYHADAKNVARAEQFGVEAFRLVGWMRSQPNIRRLLLDETVAKEVEAAAHRFNARYLLDAGNYRTVFREYRKSFQLSPKIALKEWHRWLYSGLAILGLDWLGKLFYRIKQSIKGKRG
jgi:glycosyltransferase involved in cell wall biosynthesis